MTPRQLRAELQAAEPLVVQQGMLPFKAACFPIHITDDDLTI